MYTNSNASINQNFCLKYKYRKWENSATTNALYTHPEVYMGGQVTEDTPNMVLKHDDWFIRKARALPYQ